MAAKGLPIIERSTVDTAYDATRFVKRLPNLLGAPRLLPFGAGRQRMRAGWTRKRAAHGLALFLVALAAHGHAEQFKTFGQWQIHYIAFNASMLSPAIAERYGIVRGRNKGLVNISAVGASGGGEQVGVRGLFRNLLDQSTTLDFREIKDGESVYYLAAFDFQNAEELRFEIVVDLPGRGEETVRFQQPLYVPAR